MMLTPAIVLTVCLPLADFATNSVAERIARSDPSLGLSRFLDYPHCFPEHPSLNPKFWLRRVDFSCVSPWNDGSGAIRAGTAISKRHIVCAAHLPVWKGMRMLFVGEDGGTCPCYVEATRTLPKTDIMIASLNAELTPNIHPAKLLPPDYEKHIGDGRGLPVVTFNQHEEVFYTELDSLTFFANYPYTRSRLPEDSSRAAFRKPIVGGDSGDPAFLLIGDEPILLYCLKHGGCGAGPGLHLWRNEIQNAMDELCPGYRLEVADLKSMCKNRGVP